MKKNSIRLLSLFSICLLTFCSCKTTTTTTTVEPKINAEEISEPEQPELIEIKDLSHAWETILNNSTKEFIGGHPIDDNFLAAITGIYGDELVEQIASYANFETADIWYELTGKSIHVLWYEYCKDTSLQNYSFENTYEFDTANDSEIVFDFTGDLILANDVATTRYMDSQINGITDCFSEGALNEMLSADILMTNNEFAYTDRGEALAGKAYTFRANPSRVDLLKEIGVDIAGIANNHVYDYGEIGILDTLETLENAGQIYLGAGRNLEEAKKPVYIIAGGRKIAIVAATQIERSLNYTKAATETSAGVLKCLNPDIFCEEISAAKKNSDFVIVFVHWGTEGVANYGSDQIKLANDFVAAGADAIIGGHTHCLQTVEFIGDVPVYYSLGNFFFSTTANMPRRYNTGIAQLRIQKDGSIDASFLPCYFSGGVVTLLEKDDDAFGDIINNLNSLSSTAEFDEEGHITKKQ